MKNNWKSCMVGEHVQLFQGLAINSKTKHLLQKKGTPLLRITDLINNTFSQFVDSSKVPQQCIAQEHDLIYTRTGQVGLIFKGRKGVIHNNCFKIVPDKKITRDYLYWYFRQEYIKDYAYSIASGSVQKDLNHSAFKSIEITIPPIKIQRGISYLLSTLDDKIALLRRQNETLEAMAQALFKSWFVDFDPVIDRALAAGHALPAPLQERAARRRAVRDNPNYSPLPDEVLQLFPDRLVFSEGLGKWVPVGWKTGALSALVTLETSSVKPFETPKQHWEHYSIPAFDKNGFPNSELGETIKSNKYAVLPNSVLVSKLNPSTPRIWWHESKNYDTAICSTEFMQFLPKQPKIRPFIYYLTKSQEFNNLLLSRVTGSTGSRQRARPKGVIESQIVLPVQGLIERFTEVAGKYISKKTINQQESQTLVQLRDTLLPKLISGELSVADFPEGLLAGAGS